MDFHIFLRRGQPPIQRPGFVDLCEQIKIDSKMDLLGWFIFLGLPNLSALNRRLHFSALKTSRVLSGSATFHLRHDN